MVVVIATDGSDVSIGGLRQATSVLPADADLILVSVIPPRINPNEDATGFAGPTVSPDEAARIHSADSVAADAALAATAAALGPVPRAQHVLEGEPGPAICEFATSNGADLVVVGTHGRGVLAAAVLGSVSTYVAANAPCPVLVVRQPA